MCHFITATLPKDADLKKSEEIFKRHHRRLEQIENESVREHLEKGDIYVLTTKGMCDCGTILASGSSKDELPSEVQKQKYQAQSIAKLKAKGWSETKILRWQKEQDLYIERTQSEDEQSNKNSPSRVEDWLEFIQDMLNSGSTNRIGILVHEYSGGLDNRIKIMGKQMILLEKLKPETLLEMSEDVIYDFVK